MKCQNYGKVSVIVPVYKVEKYIDQCIKSIIGQTYSNLEIILVDDGSPDNCPMICNRWENKDERIVVIHQDNLGVSAARNIALDRVTGDYVLFIDSDDWIADNMIELLVNELERLKNIDAVFCGYVEIDELGNKLGVIKPKKTGIVSRNEGIEAIFDTYATVLWNKMFRKKLLKKKIEFDNELKIGEDELWLVDVLKMAENISLVSEPLYYYRRRLEGASNDYTLTPKRLSEISAQQKVLESIIEYKSKKLIELVQMRLYYCGYKIMRLAYYESNYDLFSYIDKEIEIGRKLWYKTHDNFLGNSRRKLVENMMRIKIPKKIVRIFDKNDILEWK